MAIVLVIIAVILTVINISTVFVQYDFVVIIIGIIDMALLL